MNKNQIIDTLYQKKLIQVSQDSVNKLDIKLSALCSYPQFLKNIGVTMFRKIKSIDFDLIAGTQNDIPLATILSISQNVPMLFVRSVRKDHGTEKLIEGNYEPDQSVVIVDLEIKDPAYSLQLLGRLEGAGLKIATYAVMLDRENGEVDFIRKHGYKCTRILSINEVYLRGVENGYISKKQILNLKRITSVYQRTIKVGTSS